MAGLVVKLDRLAILREESGTGAPEPVAAALLAELGGADGIAVHLREDRRHIHDRDLRLLKRVVQTRLHLYMPSTSEMVGVALDIMPDAVVLVQESAESEAPDAPIDLVLHRKDIAETIATLQNNGIDVTLRLKPAPEQIKMAHQVNANQVELDTTAYCAATAPMSRAQAFAELLNAVKLARKLRIGVNAGGRICDRNIKSFKGFDEVGLFFIGRGIVAKSVLVGMERAVREMLDVIHRL